MNISKFHLLCVHILQFRSSILAAAYMSNISTNISRISPRLDGSRDGCMFVCEFDVFYNVIHSNHVKHSTKHRGNFSVYANFGLRNKLSNV